MWKAYSFQEIQQTSGALYAGVVCFLIMSSSTPISAGFSNRLWFVEILPKSQSFQRPSLPKSKFSAFKSLEIQNTDIRE